MRIQNSLALPNPLVRTSWQLSTTRLGVPAAAMMRPIVDADVLLCVGLS